MKFLVKMILCIFSVLILLMAVISSACIFGWVDATGLYVFVTKALADQTTCNILLGLNVVLILFAIKGIFFESSTDEEKSVGTHNVEFDAENLASGIYYYTLTAGDFSSTKKLLLMK